MFLLLFAIFLSTSFVYCDEVITLKNKSHILCAADNLETPIYTYPPIIQATKTTSLLIEDGKLWKDGWVLKNSTDVVIKDVLDKRWEDFEIFSAYETHFASVVSISLSMYGSAKTRFSIENVDKTLNRRKRDISDGWSHHSSHNEVSMPFQITIKSEKKAYWKIHNYQLRWAETISQEVSSIVVSLNDASCVVFYMYICVNCTLGVYFQGSYFLIQGTSRGPGYLPDWKSLKFSVESESEIKLVRNTTNGQQEGQWGIDIRQCPVIISNRAIRDIKLENTDESLGRSCKTFDYSLSGKQNVFGCKAGTLGEKCDLQCEGLLGPEHKYCQKHTICGGSIIDPICFCAWGYRGQFCDESCSTGSWGLSCQNKCDKCASCNPQTGNCENRSSSSSEYINKGIGIITSLTMSVLILLL